MQNTTSSDLFMEELIKKVYSCYYEIIIFVFGNPQKRNYKIFLKTVIY